MRKFDIKTPEEMATLSFDFSLDLAGEAIASVVGVTIERHGGAADANPSAMLNGPASFTAGGKVLQSVIGGVDGADYLLKAKITTATRSPMVLPAILPVRSTY